MYLKRSRSDEDMKDMSRPIKVQRKTGRWSKDEDEKLRKIVNSIGDTNWVKVANYVKNRSSSQCMQRWKQVLRPGLKKGAWTTQEDELLTKLVYQHLGSSIYETPIPKIKSWKFAEDYIKGRTSKQCRERWVLVLDPTICKAEWTQQEDETLLTLQKLIGNKWTLIKELMENNRTENSIKLRYKKLAREISAQRGRDSCIQNSKGNSSLSIQDFLEVERFLHNLNMDSSRSVV
eukprot:augustus_masked-scaffold_3-processed-gene-5.51-mRNA-1 protein AED:0.14 eAED:0.33 QI:0/-1/0/1/-1/1/1/0/232